MWDKPSQESLSNSAQTKYSLRHFNDRTSQALNTLTRRPNKPAGITDEGEAADDTTVSGTGDWILIRGGGVTPAGRYDIPACGGTAGPTGVAPGPGYEGRPEPGNTPVPGYKDNTTILDITINKNVCLTYI